MQTEKETVMPKEKFLEMTPVEKPEKIPEIKQEPTLYPLKKEEFVLSPNPIMRLSDHQGYSGD